MHWEKTVEYLFIGRLVGEDPDFFAAPLCGKQECGAGDLIANKSSLLFLIEFKSHEKDLASEEKKFHDYTKAKELLKGSDSHHLLVYGNWINEALELGAKTYFSRNNHSALLKQGGVEKTHFEKYLAQLLLFRKKDGRSSEGVVVSDYASVIGITRHGKFVGSVSLSDYTSEAFPELFHSSVKNSEQEELPRRRPRPGSGG